MKVKLYIDLPNDFYTNPEMVHATAKPTVKFYGHTRYRVIIDLPDKHFTPDSEVDVDADIEEGVKQV